MVTDVHISTSYVRHIPKVTQHLINEMFWDFYAVYTMHFISKSHCFQINFNQTFNKASKIKTWTINSLHFISNLIRGLWEQTSKYEYILSQTFNSW
jgi:hypothetical protein